MSELSSLAIGMPLAKTHPVLLMPPFRWWRRCARHPLYVAVQVLAVCCSFAAYEFWAIVGASDVGSSWDRLRFAEHSELAYVVPKVLADGSLLLALLASIVSSVHSTAPGGDLDTVSRTRFSPERRRATLVVVGVLSCIGVAILAALVVTAVGELAGTRPRYGAGEPDALSMAMAGVSLAAMPFLTVHLYFYGTTMHCGMFCCQCRLLDFSSLVKKTDPLDAATWEATVVPGAQELVFKYLKCTNDGWSLVISLALIHTGLYLVMTAVQLGRLTADGVHLASFQNHCIPSSVALVFFLLLPMAITANCMKCISALKKRHIELLATESKHPGRAAAVQDLVWALQNQGQFGFNVVGVQVTPRLMGVVVSVLFTTYGAFSGASAGSALGSALES